MTTSTPEAMRKIAQGELCEFALANGDTVRVLGKPDRGRVKVQINSMVTEYILRDLRSMFDLVGFADETVFNPLDHCTEPDNVTDILECGQYALHVTQDARGLALRAVDLETGADHLVRELAPDSHPQGFATNRRGDVALAVAPRDAQETWTLWLATRR